MPSRCLATRYASLRVPQCSVFSILPPFSATVCSMTERIFLISSSGVAGRAIKIKSYKRSSMVASFLPLPDAKSGKTSLLATVPFKRRRLATVVLVHRRIDPLRQDQFHRVARLADHLGGRFQLRLVHRPQYKLLAAAQRMI